MNMIMINENVMEVKDKKCEYGLEIVNVVFFLFVLRNKRGLAVKKKEQPLRMRFLILWFCCW
jgi:hypothetical protein